MKKVIGVLSILVVIASMTTLSISDKMKQIIEDDKPVISKRTKASPEEKKANKEMAKEYAWVGYGWRGQQWKCIYNLFMKESKFDQFADNPKSTAFGIGQMLGEKSTRPDIQLLRTYNYIEHRYKTPCKAWNFHIKKNHF